MWSIIFICFLIFFYFNCSLNNESELNKIFEESLKFQLGENPLYSNHEFWYDLQSKDTPYSINTNMPSMRMEAINRREIFWKKINKSLLKIDFDHL